MPFSGRLQAATIVLILAFDAFAAGDVVLVRDAAAGTRYGAPGPRTCPSTTAPSSGPSSAAQARAFVIGGHEQAGYGGSDALMLVSEVQVQVQVASGRPHDVLTDSLRSIDPKKKVYDIRGRSVTYTCVPSAVTSSRQQQCSRQVNQDDTGICYQTTCSDWQCTWGDTTTAMSTDTRLCLAPPSVAEAG